MRSQDNTEWWLESLRQGIIPGVVLPTDAETQNSGVKCLTQKDCFRGGASNSCRGTEQWCTQNIWYKCIRASSIQQNQAIEQNRIEIEET